MWLIKNKKYGIFFKKDFKFMKHFVKNMNEAKILTKKEAYKILEGFKTKENFEIIYLVNKKRF